MTKRVPEGQRKTSSSCIFCGRAGLTKTHIWPEWLWKRTPDYAHQVSLARSEAEFPGEQNLRLTIVDKQGGMFRQKPYLACGSCNGGWMKTFEDDVLKFIHPILAGQPVTLRAEQRRTLAGWLALIFVLAEYIDKSRGSITTTARDRAYLMINRAPPPNWTIVATYHSGSTWRKKYHHRCRYLFNMSDIREYDDIFYSRPPSNTQLATLGIESLFAQIFATDLDPYPADYRRVMKQAGTRQIWPLPPITLLGFGAAGLPGVTTLDDAAAEDLAHAYEARLDSITFKPLPPR